MRATLVVLLAGCVGVDLINAQPGAATVTYRGKNLRSDIIEERRARALEQARVYCDGGFIITAEREEGFNEHFVDVACANDAGR
jgi:hypothetical protein